MDSLWKTPVGFPYPPPLEAPLWVKPVVFSWRRLRPPRNIWPCVEIDVVVLTGDVLLASSE